MPDLPPGNVISPREAFVEFEHVQKSYDGESLVIEDFTLAIEPGEFLTLLGPSGSGKTTCLMMLAGFESATHGEIRLGGVPINHIPPHKRNIGIVFQNYALFPHMTVGGNLAFPLEVRRLTSADREKKIRQALEMVQMTELVDRYPAQLSGGQRQRAALARALVFEPKLVLMDEPLGALDKQLREHMQYEIKRIHQRLGVTVVYVTHDQAEALTMSHRVAVLHQGRIQQLATPDNLYERPANAFVAGFIGENNQLSGRVVEREGSLVRVQIDGGGEAWAQAVNCGDAGSRTLLSLRPERVAIGAGPNSTSARVQELIYLGDHIRCRMQVHDSNEFLVKVPNTAGSQRVNVGETVTIHWRPEDCLALDAPSAP